MLVGIFASTAFGGSIADLAIGRQLGVQALCVVLAAAWSMLVAWIALRVLDRTLGLRPPEGDERQGLDLSLHNESGYNM